MEEYYLEQERLYYIFDKQSDTIHRTFVDHCDWSRKESRYSIGFSFEVWRPLEKAKKCRVLGLITRPQISVSFTITIVEWVM